MAAIPDHGAGRHRSGDPEVVRFVLKRDHACTDTVENLGVASISGSDVHDDLTMYRAMLGLNSRHDNLGYHSRKAVLR